LPNDLQSEKELECVICRDASTNKGKMIFSRTKAGTLFTAHSECVEGLALLLKGHIQIPKERRTKKKSCPALLAELYEEEWFSTARSLSEIILKLKQRGYNFSKPAIANSLRRLVKEDILSRQGKPGLFNYIQKYPPQGKD